MGDLTMAERVAMLTRNYSSEAQIYERTWAEGLREMGRRLADRMSIGDCRAVIDIGTGTGALLPDLRRLVPEAFIVGVDRSEGMIARSETTFARAVMDATMLGLASDRFDAATMAFMLFHLPDPNDGLAEAHRILISGAVIGVATWGTNESWPARDVWNEELDAHGAAPGEGLLSQHELTDSPEKISALLERAGFVDVEARPSLLRRRFDVDSFIQFMTGMAIGKRRLGSLEQEAREAFLVSGRRRIEELEPDDLILATEAILATARKPVSG